MGTSADITLDWCHVLAWEVFAVQPASPLRPASRRVRCRWPEAARLLRSALLVAPAALVVLALLPATSAHAAPNGIRSTSGVAARVGQLSAQLAQADADLRQASVDASVAIEKYERAAVRQRKAADALAAARRKTRSAGAAVDKQQDRVGLMVRRNYELGGVLGTTASVLRGDPSDLITNLGYLRYVGNQQAATLNRYRQSKGLAVLAEGTARSALKAANAARRKAARAKAAAQQAVDRRHKRVSTLTAQRDKVQGQLDAIEAHNKSVRAAAAARERRQAAARRRAANTATEVSASTGGGAMVAVRAALAQQGKPYVWDAADPSVGFDCSGLALYAYQQIGIELPHSAEYQYLQGRHVSSNALRPGDLLFYSYNGRVSGIHHVTMYIGNGQIVQAADFGIPVQVVPAYFSFGYIGATRLA
ncbi:hydrolase [Actinocatenispora thailandica]|uniref:Hydrolase n=1 Tax=Actinocatenispora thailandica TaxID=227318 RepID=A0A7R7HXD2_9ACTN|nr:C40 family peptidase [Actinocatenispora thailandica]BCJ35808.1 hydrolase [Actinocatenispora thailandica]